MIGKFNNPYLPTPADDCLSVVILVNSVLFPARWETFRSVGLGRAGSPETHDLENSWRKLEKPMTWKQFLMLAERQIMRS